MIYPCLPMRAYNLVPGLAYRTKAMPECDAHVVAKIVRDVDLETVTLRTTSGYVFAFDFNDEVDVVGADPNYVEGDSNDLGTEFGDRLFTPAHPA